VDPEEVGRQVAEVVGPRPSPPRLGCPRGFFQNRTESGMRRAFDAALGHLAEAGAEVIDVPDPFDFERAIRDHRVIMAAEAAEGHTERLAQCPADYLPRIRDLIDEGRGLAAVAYLAARRHQEELRAVLADRGADLDAFVMPATLGPAPDPSTTGNPVLNSLWSFTGSPVVSFPVALSAEGLPLAIQLIEPRPLAESDLLATAAWCEDVVQRAERARRP
jgi:aspartyl-tRNA(Asn)/glutamyl-tRNA(Gln) amidotransferase subunit A